MSGDCDVYQPDCGAEEGQEAAHIGLNCTVSYLLVYTLLSLPVWHGIIAVTPLTVRLPSMPVPEDAITLTNAPLGNQTPDPSPGEHLEQAAHLFCWSPSGNPSACCCCH